MNTADKQPDDILRREHRVWQAVRDRDGKALAELFTDDYIEITLEGQRVCKSDVVTESPKIDEIESYSVESPEIRHLGADSILLSYHLTLHGTCRGNPILPNDRWATSIWVHSPSGWKCSFFQQSAFR